MDREEKRIDITSEAITQQITLATALLGVALAFSDQLGKARQGRVWDMLPYAFAPLALSVICGVLALMGVAYYLRGDGDPMKRRGVRICGILQNASFMLSVVMMALLFAVT